MAHHFRENGPSSPVPVPPPLAPSPNIPVFTGWSAGGPPTASDEQAIGALRKCGGTVVSLQAQGTFISKDRRLIFVRHSRWLTAKELEDMVRLARVPTTEFERLLRGCASGEETSQGSLP